MFRLIVGWAERALPARLHRALLPLAFTIRETWRRWRGAPIAGCAVVIENSAGHILLVRHSYGPRGWSLPGGGIASDEDPREAALREIEEELGLRLAEIEKIAVLAEEVYGSLLSAHLFTARTDLQPRPDGREVIEAAFFAPCRARSGG